MDQEKNKLKNNILQYLNVIKGMNFLQEFLYLWIILMLFSQREELAI